VTKKIDLTLTLTLGEQITIRRTDTLADYRACQDAQRRTWGITEDAYLIPVATMVGANLHGGLVLGAFLPSGEAVAISFAFLGKIEGRLCLYSQLTGVVPGYQSHGLGYQIKLVQREFARAEGIGVIAWAFDPLQARNALFNLGKLGATANRYIENMYGDRTDALNSGVPTDRLIVEWDTKPDTAPEIPAGSLAGLPRIIDVSPRGLGGSEPRACIPIFTPEAALGQPRLLLEIPPDIASLRREHPALAETWRVAVNHAFRSAFAAGYRAISFVRDDSGGERRGFYVLERL
jgi:predicted GNAT superfamily acetyltransferase